MSDKIRFFNATGVVEGNVKLPASKSESNRALIINALAGNTGEIYNLSAANDTVLMQKHLTSAAQEINAEDAGTVMRFLTAYFTITNQQKTITGTTRMQERPIGLLVEALREIGGDLEYKGNEGYPPVQINGIDFSWPAQEISVSGQISSQFISALLLISPLLPNGIKVNITPPVLSWPYITMTTEIMQSFGAKVSIVENSITVKPVPYSPASFTIEADWSAAGYWFAIAALAKNATITMQDLRPDSLQPDSIIAELSKHWGLETVYSANTVTIKKVSASLPPQYLSLDFSDCPDLAPTIIVLSAVTGVKLHLTGLESLKIKETDRVAALQTELTKIGANLTGNNAHEWELKPSAELPVALVKISTYNDHRMAMAFAPLAMLFPLEIENPGVVKKSFPGFWDEIKAAGFEVNN